MLAALGLAAVLLVAPTGASAQSVPPPPPAPPATSPTPAPPPQPTLPDPTPKVHALLATLQAMDIDKLMPLAAQNVVTKQASAQQAAQRVASAQRGLVAAHKAVSDSEDRLSSLAVTAYVQPEMQTADLLVDDDTTASGRRTVLLEVALANEQQRLADAKDAVATAQQQVALARQAQVDAASAVGAAQAVVQQLQHQASSLRTIAATAASSTSSSWQLTIEGDSEFTAAELAAWFATLHMVPKAQVPMAQLVQYYIDEGHDQGVRGDVAFAQSMVETAGFTNPDSVNLNNYAGIGHCDTCASGFAFATPQLGVRAQIQLLDSYAEVFPDYKHPLVDPRLKGPSGCCSTWNRLTKVWATDPNYGPAILGVYQRMLEWLVVERGGHIPAGA